MNKVVSNKNVSNILKKAWNVSLKLRSIYINLHNILLCHETNDVNEQSINTGATSAGNKINRKIIC